MQKDLQKLSLSELRQMWAAAWGIKPHVYIGRAMLTKSLEYKTREQAGHALPLKQQERLEQLIRDYKRNPACFDRNSSLKPGTRLLRMHKGKKHSVLVKNNGFEYQGQIYNSLSKIANDITGKQWNGWLFFGLKKVNRK